MKKQILYAAVALIAASCTSDNDMLTESAVTNPEPTQVTLTFSPYDMEQITRAAITTDLANKLDIWLYEGGQEVQAVQQESSQTDFATLSLTLDKRKTYTLYAVAHKSSGGHATLANGIISWPNDKVSQTFYCTQTFTPSENTTLNCEMDRIVGMFRIETTDAVPSEVTHATIQIAQTWTQWNTTDNGGTNAVDRTVNYSSLSTDPATGTVALNSYILSSSDEAKGHDITVTFFDASDAIVQQRTFAAVPIRNGYRTQYRGRFFTDQDVAATFTITDWSDYDVVEF